MFGSLHGKNFAMQLSANFAHAFIFHSIKLRAFYYARFNPFTNIIASKIRGFNAGLFLLSNPTPAFGEAVQHLLEDSQGKATAKAGRLAK